MGMPHAENGDYLYAAALYIDWLHVWYDRGILCTIRQTKIPYVEYSSMSISTSNENKYVRTV